MNKLGKKLLLSMGAFILVMLFTVSPVRAEEVRDGGYSITKKVEIGNTLPPEESRGITAFYAISDASWWNSCSNNYFYGSLSSGQKALYDSLYNTCMNFLVSGEAVSRGGEYWTPYASASVGMSISDAETVGRLVMTNCPQFYYLADQIYVNQGVGQISVSLKIFPDYASVSSRVSATNTFKNTVNAWLSQVNSQSTTYAKEKKAFEMIYNNTVYDLVSAHSQSAAGVFFDGRAVCAGISEAFQLLCNKIGLTTLCITSDTHEWNMVYLNGQWYCVDVTNKHLNISYDELKSHGRSGMYEVESWLARLGVPSTGTTSNGPWIYNGVDYSPVFNPTYYSTTYGDLRNAFGNNTSDLLYHFITFGMREGRQGISSFDVHSYRRQYADLRAAFGGDLRAYYIHYINFGRYEHRQTTGCTTLQGGVTTYRGVNYSAVYDYNYYSGYGDLKRAFGEDDVAMLEHFVNFGMREGRQAKSTFNVRSYRLQYPDLRAAFGNDTKDYYTHYMYYGVRERRAGTGCTTLQGAVTTLNGVNYSPVYDYNYYSGYGDLRRAFGEDDVAMLEHFVTFGMMEGRQAKSTFNVTNYKNRYADLRNAFGNNLKDYYIHYINFGRREGRNAA